ncbi:MAG: hypothetical protein AB8B69_23475 [Chitinophagales bacterium]
MDPKQTSKHPLFAYLPSIGIFLFVGLYLYSASLFPGGSTMDLDFVGFDWVHNYWCDLMHFETINGQPNPAEPYAVFALFLLCASVLIFFFMFANVLAPSPKWRRAIQICGTISMIFAALIFTEYHNLMIVLSSAFGLVPSFGIILGIAKSDMNFYKATGVLCVFLLLLNNLFYYSSLYLNILPLIQKITFAIVLLWIVGLNWELARKKNLK